MIHVVKRVERMNPTKSFWHSSQIRRAAPFSVVDQMQHSIGCVRTSLNFARAKFSERMVTLHRVIKPLDPVGAEQLRQRYGILDCNVGALTMMRQHAMRSVAEQHDAAAPPSLHRADFKQTPPNVVRNGGNHFDDSRMPALEGCQRSLMWDRRNPVFVRPRRGPFDHCKKIDVRSRRTQRKM